MFSNNRQISERQAFRMLVLEMLGVGALLIPQLLARAVGRAGVLCIAIAMGIVSIIVVLMDRVADDKPNPFLFAGYFVIFLSLAGYVLHLIVVTMRATLLGEETFLTLLFYTTVLLWYGMRGGIESRARIAELIFFVLLVMLALMIFFAWRDVEPAYLAPFVTDDMTPLSLVQGTGVSILFFAPAVLSLFTGEHMKKRERAAAAAVRAILFVGVIQILIYLILCGMFGLPYLAVMNEPIVALMSAVRSSAGFFKRADALMAGIWFFALVLFAGALLYHSRQLLQKISGRNKEGNIGNFLLAAASGITAYAFYKSPLARAEFERYVCLIGVPFAFLAPLAARLIGRSKKNFPGKKFIFCIGILCVGSLFSGCGSTELEDRLFPIEIGVDDADQIEKEWIGAASRGSRKVDYNHLKVIVLGRELMQDAESLDAFLDVLEERGDVPRNAWVVVADDPQELIETAAGEGTVLGDTVENLLQVSDQIKKEAYPTIGTLYQEQENRMETIWIPYLTYEHGTWTIDHYYACERGTPAGDVDSEVVFLAQFTDEKTTHYTLTLEGGGYVELSAQKRSIDTDAEQIIVELRCEGKRYATQHMTDAEVEESVEAYFNETANRLLRDANLDATNSYRYLWWREGYALNLPICYRIFITWVV